jgi:protein-S-isoprenylcysteine O-methyltransferase Ste14
MNEPKPTIETGSLQKTTALKLLSVISWIIGVVALVLLLMRHSLIGAGISAIIIQVASVLLMIWARLTFGLRSFHAAANPTEGGLVTTGPYRFVRHPIYASVLYFIWAGVVSHLSVVNCLLGILGSIALSIRILSEESFLKKRYPEYSEYSAKTKQIIPFIY